MPAGSADDARRTTTVAAARGNDAAVVIGANAVRAGALIIGSAAEAEELGTAHAAARFRRLNRAAGLVAQLAVGSRGRNRRAVVNHRRLAGSQRCGRARRFINGGGLHHADLPEHACRRLSAADNSRWRISVNATRSRGRSAHNFGKPLRQPVPYTVIPATSGVGCVPVWSRRRGRAARRRYTALAARRSLGRLWSGQGRGRGSRPVAPTPQRYEFVRHPAWARRARAYHCQASIRSSGAGCCGCGQPLTMPTSVQ